MHAGKTMCIHGRSCDEFLPWREKGKGTHRTGCYRGHSLLSRGTQRMGGNRCIRNLEKDTIQIRRAPVHHIHELDCVQFLMGGCPETVTMAGGNAAHRDDRFGDEDDMLFITMEYPGRRYAVLEYGSAFRWQEHYLLIQGTRGAIKIDMCSCGMTLKTGEKEEHFLVHRTKEEDDDRTGFTGRRSGIMETSSEGREESPFCGFRASWTKRWSF